ncbi:MAG: alpha/beta fold hydrolase [Gemmatimonadales bacterium]
MATYVLIHGSASDSWYWHRVAPLLEARGHTVVAPDLPVDDDAAGLADYTERVVRAVCDPHRRPKPLIVVGQSMGGFTAPLVADRIPVDLIVMLNPMIPAPRERLGSWWERTRLDEARRDLRDFFHDVPKDVVEAALARGERRQSSKPFEETWPLHAWPPVRTRVLLSRDDRFFPADFVRRISRERLGIVPDEMAGGHLVALARPEELVERLEGMRMAELEAAA